MEPIEIKKDYKTFKAVKTVEEKTRAIYTAEILATSKEEAVEKINRGDIYYERENEGRSKTILSVSETIKVTELI